MDVANLITRPGPDPIAAVKSRAVYSAAEHPTTHKRAHTSYYFSASTCKPSPQPPLSPPAEEQPKCSLPSISTLIESADSAPLPPTKRQRTSTPAREVDSRTHPKPSEASGLPPTPPLRPGSGFHTIAATGHSPSGSRSDGVLIIKSQERPGHVTLPSPADSRSSISSQGSQHHLSGPYTSPAPSVPFSSPVELPASSTMYYRCTARSAPPAPAPAQAPAPASLPPQIVPPTWQHHHYFPSSSTTAPPYQQSHDRYICRTCHKAFSRPSSLRIHSHSHTGEKPFRCTHAGCGKAFSVRSNMKRHERGCHSTRAVPAPPPATTVV